MAINNPKPKRIFSESELNRRATILAAMVSSPFWMEFVKAKTVEPGEGSMPEKFAQLADIYAAAIESLE